MTKLAVSALEEQWANLEQLHSENIQFWAGTDIQASSWFFIMFFLWQFGHRFSSRPKQGVHVTKQCADMNK